jgi:hypothetical protein
MRLDSGLWLLEMVDEGENWYCHVGPLIGRLGGCGCRRTRLDSELWVWDGGEAWYSHVPKTLLV